MANRSGIVLVEDTLTKRMATLPVVVDRAAAFAMMSSAAPIENYMKSNAPWQDQTTNARNGLAARYAGKEGGVHTLVLFHQVDYGIWLEVANDGAYAIITPSLEVGGEMVMKRLANVFAAAQG